MSVDLVQRKAGQVRILHYSAPREGEIYSKHFITMVSGYGLHTRQHKSRCFD